MCSVIIVNDESKEYGLRCLHDIAKSCLHADYFDLNYELLFFYYHVVANHFTQNKTFYSKSVFICLECKMQSSDEYDTYSVGPEMILQ